MGQVPIEKVPTQKEGEKGKGGKSNKNPLHKYMMLSTNNIGF